MYTMSNILEISNWNQLTRARADNQNLRIVVTHYNDSDSTGDSDVFVATKIQIVDYQTNDIYLTLFTDISDSTVIPLSASLSAEEVVRVINLYGFNIRISLPEVLPENVVTLLKGLYAAGYLYVYRDYINTRITRTTSVIYASDQIKIRRTGFNITKTPDFVEDEWDWCKPNYAYPIKDLIENGTVNNGQPIT